MRDRGRTSRILLLLLLLTAAAACSSRVGGVEAEGSTAALAELAQVPAPLAEAFLHLDRQVPAEDRDVLRITPPGEMLRYHLGLGMYVRNEYGLWRGGPLQDLFREKGVRHPDDMSHVVLEAYGLYLRGATVNLDSIIAAMPPSPMKFEEVSSDSVAVP